MKYNIINIIAFILLLPFLLIHLIWMCIGGILILPAMLVITLPYKESITEAYSCFYGLIFAMKNKYAPLVAYKDLN